MTKLTKSQIADRLLDFGITLSVNEVKKTSHADLQHRLATELRKTAKPVRVASRALTPPRPPQGARQATLLGNGTKIVPPLST